MPVDAFLHLESVRCITESDGTGHSEPYLWPVLLYSDATTIADQSFVRAVSPALGNYREVVKNGMQAGDVLPVPGSQQLLRVRFEDNTNPSLTLIVALFEWDETPDDAARAAYGRFSTAIVEEIRAFVLVNLRAPDPNEPSEIDPIVAAIEDKVEAAARAELSWWEKSQIAVGSLNLDDQIGFQMVSGLQPQPFTLRYEKESSNVYEITGRFEWQTVQVDACAAESAWVQRAQSVLNGIEGSIAALQEELHSGVAGSAKAAIIREIRRIRAEEIPPAIADLEAARAALAQCRAGSGTVVWHGHVFEPAMHGVFTDAR